MLTPVLVFTIHVFIFGCSGSSLLCLGFLYFGGLGLLFLVVRELIVVVSLAVEHRLGGGVAPCNWFARRLSGCVPRAREQPGLRSPWHPGFPAMSCGPGNRRASVLWHTGFQLPSGFSRSLESSKIRDQTLVSSVGMRILISSVFYFNGSYLL